MKFNWKRALLVAALLPCTIAHTGEVSALLAPMRSAHARPVVAVLALNEGTETTDFLVPHAVLQRAGVATVVAVAPRSGRVALMPALEIEVPDDLAAFDQHYPQGADYVVVPAMHTDDDPAISSWLRAQARKGARIIGICSGARVLGQAGLLDDRQFTGHWFDRATLIRRHPSATYVPDQRYLADHGVVTTTGVSASLPVSLALVEAIGGHETAQALATALGVSDWSPRHDSAPFRLSASALWTLAWNAALFWRHEQHAIPVEPGVDDVALALSADAWSRTYRSSAVATTSTGAPVRMGSGLLLWTTAASERHATSAARLTAGPAACQLDYTLAAIAQRYGEATSAWVATQIEYPANPRPPSGDCPGGD